MTELGSALRSSGLMRRRASHTPRLVLRFTALQTANWQKLGFASSQRVPSGPTSRRKTTGRALRPFDKHIGTPGDQNNQIRSHGTPAPDEVALLACVLESRIVGNFIRSRNTLSGPLLPEHPSGCRRRDSDDWLPPAVALLAPCQGRTRPLLPAFQGC